MDTQYLQVNFRTVSLVNNGIIKLLKIMFSREFRRNRSRDLF